MADDITNLAITTLTALYGDLPQTRAVGTKIAPPLSDAATSVQRQELFEVQLTRQRALEAIKCLQDLEGHIVRRVSDNVIAADHSILTASLDLWVSILHKMDQVKSHLRGLLEHSEINTAGIAILDDLLAKHIGDGPTGMLFQLPDERTKAKARERFATAEIETWITAEQVRDTLKLIHNFEPEYYLNRTPNLETEPVALETPDTTGPIMVTYTPKDAIKVTEAQYKACDISAAAVSAMSCAVTSITH